ncbi:ThuA domain-containing protein [Halogeometricum luteum]|uniref:ThuA domain-containing protein n=1 Tax=Halogeometricum luteum TaxID=2950537 RepID=A0ABU2G5J0_9EURY|nr:ThuA domain-containing protein [Halogeometricum sp. S3BR5-2]MDS0295418.1 ThuA domain-containing protein [Halogeometricum sp. S3BR5-2]
MVREPIHALVWTEATEPEDVYPNGIAATVAEHLNESSRVAARATSIEADQQGLDDDALEWADVLLWWGHRRHDDVTDETVDRVVSAVRTDGVGFISLHSAHYARPFKRLIGGSGDLGDVRWEDPGEAEVLTVEAPDHPIARGVESFALPNTEMFGEPFDVPEPDDVVLRSTFPKGGEFRSCVTFTFGDGRGVYLRPGHETFRIYHHPSIRRVLENATLWAGR